MLSAFCIYTIITVMIVFLNMIIKKSRFSNCLFMHNHSNSVFFPNPSDILYELSKKNVKGCDIPFNLLNFNKLSILLAEM